MNYLIPPDPPEIERCEDCNGWVMDCVCMQAAKLEAENAALKARIAELESEVEDLGYELKEANCRD